MTEIEIRAEQLSRRVYRLEAALKLVLRFFSPSPWKAADDKRWLSETGMTEVTTKSLCDHIRVTLA